MPNLPTSMTIGGAAYAYHDTVGGDKAIYHGANHDYTGRQMLEFIRTTPKRSGVSYGTARGYIRFTEDRTVTNADGGTENRPSITTCAINWPVGVSDSEAVIMEELEKLFTLMLFGQGASLDSTATTAGIGATTALEQIVAFFLDGRLVG